MRKAKTPSKIKCDGKVLAFDAVIKRETSYEADVPEYPIEEGFYTTDSVLKKPVTLNVKAFISDTPASWGEYGGSGRLKNALKTLEYMYFSGQLVSFMSNGRVYSSMVMESLTIPETEDMINAVEVEFTLKQVRIAEAKSTTIPDEYGLGGSSEQDAGTSVVIVEQKGTNVIEAACSWIYNLFK